MELTREYLIENGYSTNHPEKVLCTFFKQSKNAPEWRITLTQHYDTHSNQIRFNIECWRNNEEGETVKRIDLTNVIDTYELEACIELCGINQ